MEGFEWEIGMAWWGATLEYLSILTGDGPVISQYRSTSLSVDEIG